MKRIGLLSDTHNFLDDAVFRHFDPCDEIWHAGDFGSQEIADRLKAFRPLRGVYGNIDGNEVRSVFPEKLIWQCEEVKIYMTHIGGYPPKYNPAVKKELETASPNLFVCGHSHILRIMYDDRLQCLHMIPGAAGHHGWHKIRTIIRFSVDRKGYEEDCEVMRIGRAIGGV